MKKLYFFSLLILISFGSYAQAFLQIPIEGAAGNTWTIVNYVDWDSVGFKDYNCGTKSYDGHEGSDFTIRSFKEMDGSVAIFAAASGRVIAAHDGDFDRETNGDVSKGLGNYVGIRHPNKYYTYYGHLRKNSILVAIGDSVTAGELIGYVGSSGNSTDPHLHFEVWYDSLYVVDPFNGICGNANSLFINPPKYDTGLTVWESGLHLKNNLTINDLRERISTINKPYKIGPSSDSSLNFWSHLYGLRKGKNLTIKWYTPTNAEWFTFTTTLAQDYWYYYYWSFISHKDLTEGTWNVKLEYDGVQIAQETFVVSKTASVSSQLSKKNCSISQTTPITELLQNPNLEISLTDMQGRELDKNAPTQTGLYLITIKRENEVCVMKRMGSF